MKSVIKEIYDVVPRQVRQQMSIEMHDEILDEVWYPTWRQVFAPQLRTEIFNYNAIKKKKLT